MRIVKAILAVAVLAAAAGAQAQHVKATLNYPLGVNGVAVDYVRNRAYVLLPGFNADGSTAVQVLNGHTSAVLNTYSVPVSGAIAVNVLTGTVYVAGVEPSNMNASGVEGVVVAVHPDSGNVIATIPVTANSGLGLVALAVNPVTEKVYVSNDTDNTIAVINGKRNEVTDSISLNGQTPAGIAVNFLTGKVYATLNDNQVAILKEGDSSVEYATYGSQTSGVAVDLRNDREYVTDGVFDTPTVGVLSQDGSTLASIPVGLFPQGVDVDFVTNLVFVANEADGTVSRINASNNTVTATISVAANSVAVNPLEATVYAVGSTSVTVLTEQ
jgi:YVTN family beta-propeller protein